MNKQAKEIRDRYFKETNEDPFNWGESLESSWTNEYVEWLESKFEELENNAKKMPSEWNEDKIIDFVNWYIRLHKLGIRYELENRTLFDDFNKSI